MADSLKVFIAEMRVLWGKIGINQKIALGVLLTALVAALSFWGSWNSNDEFGLLFKNLRAKDAGEIINVLKADGIPYRVEDKGTAVLVPDDQVYDLRLKLAGQGLPGEGEGWTLFDQNRLGGLSDFVQQVNHTRALQSELERSISRLRQIQWARVHIVEAKESLFIDKKEPATASVLIKTRSGARLTDGEISGITHLIAGAVRGLTPENVTITDHSGRQLSRPGGNDTASLASNQLDYRRQVEEHLSNRATQMLERIVGPGKAVVTVSAEIDFSSSESHKIEYKSDITKSKTETTKETTAPASGGEVGVQANAGGARAGGGGSTSSTREERVEYMPPVPASETKLVEPGGKIKRLAAAVFVSAGAYKTSGAEGEEVRKYVAASGSQIKEYEQIVKNAIGFEEERGDSITVSDGEFKGETPVPAEELKMIEVQNFRQFVVGLVKSGSTALGVLLFLLFARHMLKKTFTGNPLLEGQTQTVALDRTARAPGREPSQTESAPPLKDQVTSAVSQNPEKAAQHLKMWMNR